MNTPIIILLLVIACPAFGQITLRNAHCNNPDCKSLFTGLENHIIVEGVNPNHKISLSASNGSKISQHKKNEFSIYGSDAPVDTLKLVVNGKIVHREVFTVEPLQDPVAIIGTFINTALSTSQITLNPYLNVSACKSGLKSNYLITSFKLVVTNNSGDVFDFVNQGREFSQTVKNTIKTLGKGSTLNFHYIKCIGPDNISRLLPDLAVMIQ